MESEADDEGSPRPGKDVAAMIIEVIATILILVIVIPIAVHMVIVHHRERHRARMVARFMASYSPPRPGSEPIYGQDDD